MNLKKLYIKIRSSVQELLHLFKISIFENQCKICENDLIFKEEKHICNDCYKSIKRSQDSGCKKCGKRIKDDIDICGECMINPPSFKRHLSFSTYEGNLRELILKSKYREIEPLKKLTLKYFIETYSEIQHIKFDQIIPVPMDKSRDREYDHILEITKSLSKILKIRLNRHDLKKTKQTLPQAGLTMAKRLNNLNGAFQLSNKAQFKNKKILLIDDVYTTGTTIKKCSAPIIKAGATVYAITLGRSV